MLSPINTLYTYFPLQFFICLFIDICIAVFGMFWAKRLYRKGKFDLPQTAAMMTLFICIAAILFFTVLGRRTLGYYRFELMPLKSYYEIIIDGNKTLLRSDIGNILAFVPIGFTLCVVFKHHHRVLFPLLLCFGFSCSIELLQLVLQNGLCETDDVINNTLGGLIGIVFCVVLCYIIGIIRRCAERKEDFIESKRDN